MTVATKTRARVGDTRWVVEWCVELGYVDPEHPEYGCNPDANKVKYRSASTEAEALAIAKEVYSQDQYGSVSYSPQEFVAYDDAHAQSHPHAGFWEDTDDALHYEGEQ